MNRSRHAVLLLTGMMSIGCYGSGHISADEATEIVLRDVIGELDDDTPLVVFRYPEMIGTDDLLASYVPAEFDGAVPEINITDDSWLFWVDDEPGAWFTHDSRLVLVTEDGELSTVALQWWPLLNEAGLWLNEDYWGEDRVLTHQIAPPTDTVVPEDSAATTAATAPPSPKRDKAIVINAWNPNETGWSDMARDGQDQTLLFESMDFEVTYYGQAGVPGDENLPGDPEVDQQVSQEAVIDQLDEYADQLQAGDRLVIFLTGHGWTSEDTGHGYIGDFNTVSLSDALAQFDDGVFIAVIADGCQSGGFQQLKTEANVVITATDDVLSSYGDIDNYKSVDDINAGDQGSEFSSSFNAAMWEILSDPEEVEVIQDMADFLGVDWMTVLFDAAFADSWAFDAAAQLGLTLPQISSDLDDIKPDETKPDETKPDPEEGDTAALDEISDALHDDPMLLAAAIIAEVFDHPIKHSAGNVPDSKDDTPSTKARAYGIDGGELIREKIEEIFETGSARSALRLPCGDGSLGHTVCPDNDLAMPEGDYVFAYQILEGPLSITTDGSYITHSFVFNGDCLADNNYQPAPSYPNDFFQDTDTWYVVDADGSAPPTLRRMIVHDDNSVTTTTTQARVVIRDDTMVAVIPAAEFDCAEPGFRVTAFRHNGDWGMGSDHDWSGDTEPPVDQGLAAWPN